MSAGVDITGCDIVHQHDCLPAAYNVYRRYGQTGGARWKVLPLGSALGQYLPSLARLRVGDHRGFLGIDTPGQEKSGSGADSQACDGWGGSSRLPARISTLIAGSVAGQSRSTPQLRLLLGETFSVPFQMAAF
jgi:hypothetical protein